MAESPNTTPDLDSQAAGAIRALYEELMAAWNRGSGRDFAGVFTRDGDLVAFDGVHFRGQQEIEPAHQALFDRWLKGSRLVGHVESIRFLSANVAVAQALGNMVGRGKTAPAPERASIQTLVAVRTDGRWRLAAFQNTRVRPIGLGALSFFVWTIFDRLWRLLRLSTRPGHA